MKLASAIAGLAFLGTLSVAHASAVDVTYTVSGSAGNLVYDFSVINNIGGANGIYLFGVRLNVDNRVGSPVGWDPNAFPGGLNWFNNGGSATNYNNNWVTCPTLACPIVNEVIETGQTLSGFKVLDSGLTALTNVSFFAVAFGDVYSGPDCSFQCLAQFLNPGFEGLATEASVSASATPLPGALPLFASGLAAFGTVVGWRRRRATTAA